MQFNFFKLKVPNNAIIFKMQDNVHRL